MLIQFNNTLKINQTIVIFHFFLFFETIIRGHYRIEVELKVSFKSSIEFNERNFLKTKKNYNSLLLHHPSMYEIMKALSQN
jgi:hypothetical protein